MGFTVSKILSLVFVDFGNLCVIVSFLFSWRLLIGRRRGRQGLVEALFLFNLFLLFIAVFPVSDLMMRPLENAAKAELPKTVDGILMLTGDEKPAITAARGVPAFGTVAGRYVRFAELARAYPKARLAFIGGSGFLQQPEAFKNGPIARQVFSALGIREDRLLIEDSSRTTYENAKKARALLEPVEGKTFLLVTSALHMPRALAVFRAQGWTVFPAPVDFKTLPKGNFFRLDLDFSGHLQGIAAALHEYIGFLVYWIEGRVAHPWPV